MQETNKVREKINDYVESGLIPIAFTNSIIREQKHNKIDSYSSSNAVHPLYKQSDLPLGKCVFLISKIYDFS